jgi:hypothetical protein
VTISRRCRAGGYGRIRCSCCFEALRPGSLCSVARHVGLPGYPAETLGVCGGSRQRAFHIETNGFADIADFVRRGVSAAAPTREPPRLLEIKELPATIHSAPS